MPTGSKIKEIRQQKGFTQKQLGDMCGMADSAIRRYENGKANPKIETLQKIANALEVPLYDLLVSTGIENIDGMSTPVLTINTEGFSMKEVEQAFKEVEKKYNTASTPSPIDEVEYQEVFFSFLEWLGYKISVLNYEEMQRLKISASDNDDYLIAIQDNKHDNVTFFHKKDFLQFEKEIARTVDYEIYKRENLRKDLHEYLSPKHDQ